MYVFVEKLACTAVIMVPYCSLLMESERWKQCDVPPEIQDIVIAIETCKNKSLEVKPSSSTQQSKDYLMVKGQNFAVVG